MTTIADKCIEILQLTRDGDDLDPKHLKLVELAVNNMLNSTGVQHLEELLQQVRKGYVKPWFHNVEHLTRNHEGYVLWKGAAVEHFSARYAASEEAADAARELARRCMILEGKGIIPDTNSVIWRWTDS